jgi:hypothetical protein
MPDPDLLPPIEVPWKLASTTQPLAAGEPAQTSISLFAFEPDDANLTAVFPDQRLVYLKFTVSVSPADIPGIPPVAALGEGVPCLHVQLDLKVSNGAGDIGTIRPYLHAAAPMHRTMVQTGLVGADAFEGESDAQSMGRSGSQMYESSSSSARTNTAGGGASIGIGPFSIGGSARTTSTDVSGSRSLTQQIDTTQRDASQERRELLSHMTRVENVLTLLNAKYVGTPHLRFSLSPRPLQLLSVDPTDPNLWFSQLLARRSTGIEGVQEFTVIVLVPRDEDFCVEARLRRVCVLDNPPGPLSLDERFQFNQHFVRILSYLNRAYPRGTPLEDLDLDLFGLLSNPQDFARPVVGDWVASAIGYFLAEVVSPRPQVTAPNLAVELVPYKSMIELWLETQRDEYEREVARSPIERGILLGENRTLDTCFAASELGLVVSSSDASVSPFRRIVIAPGAIDLGGIKATASRARASVRDRANEANTRWNLLDERLAALLSNSRPRERELSLDDDDVLDLVIEAWTRLRAGELENLLFEDAVGMLGLTRTQSAALQGAGATDLRSIAQLLRSAPEIDAYNAAHDGLREEGARAEEAVGYGDEVPHPLAVSQVSEMRRDISSALSRLAAVDSSEE